MTRRIARIAFVATVAGACTIAPAPEGTPAFGGSDELPPPGFGTLRQEEVSMALASGGLQIMVTPLDQAVTLVTAPDTYERLSSTAISSRADLPAESRLFLVSFFSDEPDVRFVPEDVQFLSRGFRMRPVAIHAITPGWGQHRVAQRQTEMAVYAFPPELALETDLTLVYGLDESNAWSGILPRVQAERARARARAGIGGSPADTGRTSTVEPRPSQTSSPYFEILR